MQEKLFPVVDISYLVKHFGGDSSQWKQSDDFKQDKQIHKLANELRAGFETWGFLYIKGHNIPENLVENAFNHSLSFFQKPLRDKSLYLRGKGINEGWLGPENEVFDLSTKSRDMKEAFDFRPNTDIAKRLSKQMPDLVDGVAELFEYCTELALKFLRLLAVALEIDTENYAEMHSMMGDRKLNGTAFRTLYYPEVKDDENDSTGNCQEQRRRIHEHTDYGTITLLFQDQVGGLEVLSPTGEFVQAVPIPGTIVINAGDMLRDWSRGQFKATTHRVIVPADTGRCTIPQRQSMAFFCHPNYDVVIGENKENSYEILSRRFDETIVVDGNGTEGNKEKDS